MMGVLVYPVLALIVAGIVHLASILAMPALATRDGYHRMFGLAQDNQMTLIAEEQMRDSVPFTDPATATAACRYVLTRGPVRVRVAVGATPLTLMLLRRGGGIFHSVSDRAATQGVLEVVIATAAQMDSITELDADDEPVQEIRVTSADETGLVILRGLTPTPSQRDDVEALVANATCEAESLDGAAP